MIEFRNKYEENEKLFSTGDEDLDDLLQEVYYSGIEDGYDYAQKEFTKQRVLKKQASRAYNEAGKILRKNGNNIRKAAREGNIYGEGGVMDMVLDAKAEGFSKAVKANPKAWASRNRQIASGTLPESVRKGRNNQSKKFNNLAKKYGYPSSS